LLFAAGSSEHSVATISLDGWAQNFGRRLISAPCRSDEGVQSFRLRRLQSKTCLGAEFTMRPGPNLHDGLLSKMPFLLFEEAANRLKNRDKRGRLLDSLDL